MYKALEGLAWFCVLIAFVMLVFGLIGAFIGGSFIISPRGCTLLSSVSLLFALNFSLFRSIKLREGETGK